MDDFNINRKWGWDVEFWGWHRIFCFAIHIDTRNFAFGIAFAGWCLLYANHIQIDTAATTAIELPEGVEWKSNPISASELYEQVGRKK